MSRPGKKKTARADSAAILKSNTAVYVFLSLATLAAYSTAFANGITNWDDSVYLYDNPLLKKFSIEDLFSSYVASNYHPVTILSYCIEHFFFGFNPKAYHTVNVLLHLTNGVLLFMLIDKLFNRNIALIVASLFCIHPMHVESVAWISERKDLLYTLFFFLSLNKYLVFARKREGNLKYYWYSLLFFLIALLSKGMAVTLTFFIVCIDVLLQRKFTKSLILEKLPYLVLSLVFGVIAIMAQGSTEAMNLKAGYTFFERVMFASYAFGVYVYKLFLPVNLSAFYTYPDISQGYSIAFYFGIVMLFVCVGLLVVAFIKKNWLVLVGLLIFMSSISIVLQLIPVGSAIVAERYTYIPYIGLFLIVAYYFDKYYVHKIAVRQVLILGLTMTMLAFIYITRERCKVWQNSDTLWSDVIAKHPDADLAYLNRGIFIVAQRRKDEAYNDFTKAIELNASYTEAYNNRGLLKQESGQYDASIEDFTKAIETDVEYYEGYSNRGVSYISKGMLSEAIKDFDKTLELNPIYANVFSNRGNAYIDVGNFQKGLEDLKTAQRLYREQGNPNGLSRVSERIRQVEAAMIKPKK